MAKDEPVETFGCSLCWPASAEDAWAATSALAVERVLVDESHYVVAIRRCSRCGQHFLSVSTEMIDWAAGEDPVHVTFMPLTPAELAGLAASAPPSEGAINAVGVGRRSLKYDSSSSHPPAGCWDVGILVGPHH